MLALSRILKQEISHLSLQSLEALRCLKMWEFLSRNRCSLTRDDDDDVDDADDDV